MDRLVSVSVSRAPGDFGRGFYCTTQLDQAENWARDKVGFALTGDGLVVTPKILVLSLPRSSLARLTHLAFIVGKLTAADYWSFVSYSRAGGLPHGYTSGESIQQQNYDVVYGPVSWQWRRKTLREGFDQISFHTESAQRFLNADCHRSLEDLGGSR